MGFAISMSSLLARYIKFWLDSLIFFSRDSDCTPIDFATVLKSLEILYGSISFLRMARLNFGISKAKSLPFLSRILPRSIGTSAESPLFSGPSRASRPYRTRTTPANSVNKATSTRILRRKRACALLSIRATSEE